MWCRIKAFSFCRRFLHCKINTEINDNWLPLSQELLGLVFRLIDLNPACLYQQYQQQQLRITISDTCYILPWLQHSLMFLLVKSVCVSLMTCYLFLLSQSLMEPYNYTVCPVVRGSWGPKKLLYSHKLSLNLDLQASHG